MRRGRVVIWDSLFTVLAVYKKILPGNLFTGAEFQIQSCLFQSGAALWCTTSLLEEVSFSSLKQYSADAGLCSKFDSGSSQNPEQVLPANQPLGKPPQP